VQKRILSVTIFVFLISLIIVGCSKLDTTDIGSELLPAIDNVNTFEGVYEINTTQGIFATDSTQVSYTDDLVLGKINNDPLFGTTKADVYVQYKPSFYPYYYGIAKDTITNFDSVVLCLSYKGYWGDSTIPVQLQVKEVVNNIGNNSFWDSVNNPKIINYAPVTSGTILGSASIDIASLGTYKVFANHKDSVKNQIRIKLTNTSFLNALFARDSSLTGPNNSFRTDSLFKAFQNGFAIIASGTGNSIVYTNLTDSSSRLEIHYRKKNGGAIDTTFSSFIISNAASSSATSAIANNIVRNRSTGTVSAPASDEIYLQATPGTFANLRIPALDTMANKVIHRAEIIVEQIPSVLDDKFAVPNYLYMDLVDTGLNKWKPVYFDLNPSLGYDPDNKTNYFYPTSSGAASMEIDFTYFGGFAKPKTDLFGNQVKAYNFNITRHVQQIVTRHTKNYDFRLYAPYDITYPQYAKVFFPFYNRLAYGRVKVGGGTNANYKMRLRLVYSKI
jgi:hypothetical protein